MGTIKIKQHDVSDCGVACIASVAAYYGKECSLAAIRKYSGTNEKGTTLLGLIQAAKTIGFEAKGVRASTENIHEIPTPSIAHLQLNENMNHFVVLYKNNGTKVTIMDPENGKLSKIAITEFGLVWTGVLILIRPDGNFKKGILKIPVYKRFWELFRPHKAIYLQAFIGAVIYTLLGFSTSLYIQKLTDFVFIGGNTNLLNLLSIAMLFLLLLQTLIILYKDIYLTRTGQLIDLRLILGYYNHILRLPQYFFDSMKIGEILSRINDAIKIRKLINSLILNISVNILILIFSFILMFTVHWYLAVTMSLIIPIYLFIYMLFNWMNKKTERHVIEASANLESQIIESLNTIKTIKHFNLEDYTYEQTEISFIQFLKKGYSSAMNLLFSVHSTSFISALFTIVLLWTGSYFVVRREITPGELLSLFAIIAYFTGPVSRLINSNKEIQNALIATDRLFEIMDLELENLDNSGIRKQSIEGEIVFKNVSFAYIGRGNIFKGLNLRIPKSRITAIVGETGSGKSTIINLIQKFYGINEGQILLDQTDLKYLHYASLRRLISVVPQEIHIFYGNILDNIAIGESNPNIGKVHKICSLLGLTEFIEALPKGFETNLGENGAFISGGQKQRIAIARALYRDPQVLILDEATSSLDYTSENYINRALLDLRNNRKTILIITHRMRSVHLADKICVLHKGLIAEEGTHSELFHKKGHYFRLCQQQFPSTLPVA